MFLNIDQISQMSEDLKIPKNKNELKAVKLSEMEM